MLSLLLIVFVTFFVSSNAFIQPKGYGYRRYIQLNMIDNSNDKNDYIYLQHVLLH
jgi:hypothetical protein